LIVFLKSFHCSYLPRISKGGKGSSLEMIVYKMEEPTTE